MPGFYEERIFSRLCDLLMRQFEYLRPRLLQEAQGRVLELGHGSGLNLPHFGPRVSELVAIEPSGGMSRISEKRHRQVSFPVELLPHSAERIPLPDASFDTVVSTFTFCTIADYRAAAAEARRLLKPGGRLLFLEHVLNPREKIARWQRRITPLWRKVFCGCELDRDLWRGFEEAGFDLSEATRIDVDAPAIVGHLIVGPGRPA